MLLSPPVKGNGIAGLLAAEVMAVGYAVKSGRRLTLTGLAFCLAVRRGEKLPNFRTGGNGGSEAS